MPAPPALTAVRVVVLTEATTGLLLTMLTGEGLMPTPFSSIISAFKVRVWAAAMVAVVVLVPTGSLARCRASRLGMPVPKPVGGQYTPARFTHTPPLPPLR